MDGDTNERERLSSGAVFGSSFFGALLTGDPAWTGTLRADGLEVREPDRRTHIPFEATREIRLHPGLFWSDLTIEWAGRSKKLGGIGNVSAQALADALNVHTAAALLRGVEIHRKRIVALRGSLGRLLESPRYVASRDVTQWAEAQRSEFTAAMRAVTRLLDNPLFPTHALKPPFTSDIADLKDVFLGKAKIISDRNAAFVNKEVIACQADLSEALKKTLTPEQCRAAVVMEDRNLLVAAAGSGKTSALLAKVRYALQRGYATPDQLLVLAFNTDVVDDLEDEIAKLCGEQGQRPTVRTFHGFGRYVVAQVEDRKPSVPKYVDDPKAGRGLIRHIVDRLLETDPGFAENWVSFKAFYSQPPKDPARFATVEEWDQHLNSTAEYEGGRKGYRTLNGELVRSQGERGIANWLFRSGVEYEYERPYEYETANRQFSQYRPDFYLPGADCYLEHYALDANGEPPPAFGERYAESMRWKSALHAQKGTSVIETRYSEFASGDLFVRLEEELSRRGVVLHPRSINEMLARIRQHHGEQSDEFLRLIQTVIKHVKANQIQLETHIEKSSRQQGARGKIFIQLVAKIANEYKARLDTDKSVDFEDMLIKAGHYLVSRRFESPYKLILVDEFQDISRDKADLLIGLLKNAPDCRMFAVGDDWQSIYRFAGSDISLFSAFSANFGATATNYLTRTFRSNRGITDVASRFVQRNPAQIKKRVEASDTTSKGVVAVRKVARAADLQAHLSACLAEIASKPTRVAKRHSVFLLGRYWKEKPRGLDGLSAKFRRSLTLEFKTIHGAKGLEADYVILLGLGAGRFSFPSAIADDPLLDLVMPQPELFAWAEERRLFYVALTRARHGVFLLVDKFAPSPFVKEIEEIGKGSSVLRYPESEGLNRDGTPVEKCPKCERGALRRRAGPFGPFWGCSEYPSCSYKRSSAQHKDPPPSPE